MDRDIADLRASPAETAGVDSQLGVLGDILTRASGAGLVYEFICQEVMTTDNAEPSDAQADMQREAAQMTRMASAISEYLKRAHPQRYMQMVLEMNPEYLVSKPVTHHLEAGTKIRSIMEQGKLKLRVLPGDGLEIKLFV